MFSYSFREQIDGIKNGEKTKDDRAVLFSIQYGYVDFIMFQQAY